MEEQKTTTVTGTFACTNCGADLTYKPGSTHLNCTYCGTDNHIPEIKEVIKEFDFHQYIEDHQEDIHTHSIHVVNCGSCGATTSLEPNVTGASCAYCASPLVADQVHKESIIEPKSLLPFKLNKEEALAAFKKWVDQLWFAPNKLKKATLNFDHFKGVYIPYWTFDANTFSKYVGQRGDYYYVTESYTTTENGKTVSKTRQVRRTRWSYASGDVDHFFDDVLTVATKSLSQQHIYQLEPWDLENLIPFDKKYLSGFITEKYQVDLEDGFSIAKGKMGQKIEDMVRLQIGGDTQRILSVESDYRQIKFKHLLLPVYVSAYRFNNKLFRFLVNGRTGEVQGERPWSWIKISLAVLTGITIAGILYFISQS